MLTIKTTIHFSLRIHACTYIKNNTLRSWIHLDRLLVCAIVKWTPNTCTTWFLRGFTYSWVYKKQNVCNKSISYNCRLCTLLFCSDMPLMWLGVIKISYRQAINLSQVFICHHNFPDQNANFSFTWSKSKSYILMVYCSTMNLKIITAFWTVEWDFVLLCNKI